MPVPPIPTSDQSLEKQVTEEKGRGRVQAEWKVHLKKPQLHLLRHWNSDQKCQGPGPPFRHRGKLRPGR